MTAVLPALVETYGSISAAISAEWYTDARALAQVGGVFTPVPARIPDTATDSLAAWAASTGTDLDAIFSLMAGGFRRRVLTWGRQTITRASLLDPGADGWQRAGAGACDFCEMLIGRGAVYSEETADFSAHDDCHCQAVPAFRGKPRPVRSFKPSERRSAADQARVRAWLADHHE